MASPIAGIWQRCLIFCRAARVRLRRCLSREGVRGRVALLAALVCFLLTLPPQPRARSGAQDAPPTPRYGEIHVYPGYEESFPEP